EDTFYFLEVNTIPGMTDLSDLPMSARAMGMTFEDVVGGVVEVAEKRNRR
ncbi:MAG: D-alanine--D-alanine ligase, partial [Mesotoga infera]